MVWEIPYYPTYYFPAADVHAELVEDGPGKRSPSRGDATAYTVKVDSFVDGALQERPKTHF